MTPKEMRAAGFPMLAQLIERNRADPYVWRNPRTLWVSPADMEVSNAPGAGFNVTYKGQTVAQRAPYVPFGTAEEAAFEIAVMAGFE